MRSLRELLRHYTAVNGPERPRHPVRFGALLFLALAGGAVLFVTSGGPDRAPDSEVASSSAPEVTADPSGGSAGAIVLEPRGEGWYLGYTGPMTADAIDAAALEAALLSWSRAHPAFLAEPVLRDGIVVGYLLQPVG